MSGEINKAKDLTLHQNEVKINHDGTKTEKEFENTVFKFKDDDGIIQKEDIVMSVNVDGLKEKGKQLLEKIDAFFEKFTGKKWNFFTKNYLILLADRFNRKNSYMSKEVTYDKNGNVEKSYTAERSNNGNLEVINKSKKNVLGNTKSETITTNLENNTKETQTELKDSDGVVRKSTDKLVDKNNETKTKEVKKFRKDGSLRKTLEYKKNEKTGVNEVLVTKYDKNGNIKRTETFLAKDYKPKLEEDSEE